MPARKPLLLCCFLVAFALTLSACSGSESGDNEVGDDELGELVLQPADLPQAFIRFDEGRMIRLDYRAGPRQSRTRFGREDGWKARYRRRGGAGTTGPLVIESLVDVFAEDAGAERDLEAYETELASPWTKLADPPLGEESIAVTLRQGSGRFAQRFFTLAWRDGHMTASISASGFDGRLTFADVLSLARKQQARLEQAA